MGSLPRYDVPIENTDAWLRVLVFYESNYLSDSASSTIAWIGSIQTFLLVTTGVLAGPLFDKGYVRSVIITGCFLVIFAFVTLSLSTKYYQIFLTQGVCYGVGSGLAYVPSLALVGISFGKNRAIAVGIVTTGASVGGVIFPIIFRRLQPLIGFPWTVRVIGFIQLGLAVVALLLLLRVQLPVKPPRKLFQVRAFTEPAFGLRSVAICLQFLAYFILFFFIPTFAIKTLGTSEDLAFYLLAVANAASLFGRIGPAFIIQRVGAMPVLVLGTSACVAILFGWIGVHSLAGFSVFCVLWGLLSGVMVSAYPIAAALPPITPDLATLGTRLGMLWMCAGIGILIGTPVAGALVDSETWSFTAAQAFTGTVMAVGVAALVYPWMAINRAARYPQQ